MVDKTRRRKKMKEEKVDTISKGLTWEVNEYLILWVYS
jgi:hypothetical protein